MKKFFEFYELLQDQKLGSVPFVELRANWKWGERWGKQGVKVRGGIDTADLSARLEKLDENEEINRVLKLTQIISMDNPSLEPSVLPIMNQLFSIHFKITPSLVSLLESAIREPEYLDVAADFLNFVEDLYDRISRELGKSLSVLDRDLKNTKLDYNSLNKIEEQLHSLDTWLSEGVQRLKDEMNQFRSTINL